MKSTNNKGAAMNTKVTELTDEEVSALAKKAMAAAEALPASKVTDDRSRVGELCRVIQDALNVQPSRITEFVWEGRDDTYIDAFSVVFDYVQAEMEHGVARSEVLDEETKQDYLDEMAEMANESSAEFDYDPKRDSLIVWEREGCWSLHLPDGSCREFASDLDAMANFDSLPDAVKGNCYDEITAQIGESR